MTGLKRLAESHDDSSTSETVATPSEFMVVRNAWVVSRHVRVWVCLEMVYYASYSHSKWHHDPSSVCVPMDYSTGTPDQLLLAGRDFQG